MLVVGLHVLAFRHPALRIGVLAPETAVQERMADENRRPLGNRKILVAEAPEGHTVRLGQVEDIVLVLVLGIGQIDVDHLRHVEHGIGNVPVPQNTAVLLEAGHVVNIARMDRVFLAGVRKAQRKVLVTGALVRVGPARTAALVVDVHARRGRYLLRMGGPKRLFEAFFLTAEKIGQVGERLFSVVEISPIGGYEVSVEDLRETEVAVIGPQRSIQRDRRTAQVAQIGRTDSAPQALIRVIGLKAVDQGIYRGLFHLVVL